MTAPVLARVLTYERSDPRDLSLDWMRAHGLAVRSGRADADPSFRQYSEAQIIADAQGFEAVLGSSSAHFSRRVIEALPCLRFISKLGIGTDSIDVAAATERGILVSNTPEEAGVAAVAEHAMAILLAVAKRLTVWTPGFLRAGGWRGETFAGMLDGQTVGIVGFGRIGKAVAARLAGWNVRLIAYDPNEGPATPGVEMVGFHTLLEQSDVVTLHCGATGQNRHLIDRKALGRMKTSAILVNTGRGALVDTAALVEAVKSGALAGAALDVFETEPPDPEDELFRLDNVVVTPHAATRTVKVYLDRRWMAARNLYAMIRGEPCPNIVNPQASPRP